MKSALRNSASVVALVVILFISLYSISGAISNSEVFEKYYNWLVFFNVSALVSLIGLIVYNLYKLSVQYRLKQVGSRLTARMLIIFAVLTIIPVSIVFYFSLTFIHRSIDSWFDVGIEQALEDSLQLSKSALGIRKREALKKTKNISYEIPNIKENLLIVYLNDARTTYEMNELTLIGTNKSIIASSSVNSTELPSALSFPDVGELGLGNHYLALESIDETGLQIRVVIPMLGNTASTKPWQLHALFPLTDQINELSEGVETAFAKYKELAVLREPLKNSFLLALSLIWLLSVLSAIWLAFLAAKKLVSPINDLVEGTRAVAAGDYEKQLPLSGTDELGFLLRSFNTMTRKISHSCRLIEETQLLEKLQRAYLESVLEHISSAVLTFDHEYILKKANTSAEVLLGINISASYGCNIKQLISIYPLIEPLLVLTQQHLEKSEELWQEEIAVFGVNGRMVLQLRGSIFELESSEQPGHVVVIDDLTTLIQAQKNVAWSEMARRLAHEIKNPLTPIQLSAERLKHKLSAVVPNVEKELLNRYTDTIVQQVEAMKVMVNGFTDYARSSDINSNPIDFNQIVENVASLYEPQAEHIKLELEAGLPLFQGDGVRIRQVIHNLVKNALEADEQNPTLVVKTQLTSALGCKYIDILFTDGGAGIEEQYLEQIFEPYVTTKASGTGLGLAIVKKIVEEHGGRVWAQNNEDKGACFGVRFPLIKIKETHESNSKI
ncbi:MAG: HAMP domain-containing protein [Gammaproteobacteria bacterium]|nr:HAMP domain-containing protein [Gammaproteobacteria bacterium]